MASIFERRMSSFPPEQPERTIPQRRRHEDVEIIELNSESEDDATPPQPALPMRPSQRRRLDGPEVIVLTDSDDDDEVQIVGTSAPRARSNTAARNRWVSPPPRQPQSRTVVPPVPALPNQYRPFASFPLRPNPPPHRMLPPSTRNINPNVAGIIRPLAQPFGFENNMHAAARARVAAQPEEPVFEAAPRSHHTPSMGLGGALISSFRRQTAPVRSGSNTDRSEARSRGALGDVLEVAGNNIRRAIRAMAPSIQFLALPGISIRDPPEPEDMTPEERRIIHALRMEHDMEMRSWGLDDRGWNFDRAIYDARRRGENPQYLPKYTHPHPTPSGFSYDFVPPEPPVTKDRPPKSFPVSSADNPIIIDDEFDDSSILGIEADGNLTVGNGKGKQKEKTVSLIKIETNEGALDTLNASLSTAAGPKPESPVTISTLLVCARCLDPLLHSTDGLTDVEREKKRLWGLRCGHLIDGKCMLAISRPVPKCIDVLIQESFGKGRGKGKGRDIKGKGRAKEDTILDLTTAAILDDISTPKARGKARKGKERALNMGSLSSLPPVPTSPGIRSRLRSRNQTSSSSSSSTHVNLLPSTPVGPSTSDFVPASSLLSPVFSSLTAYPGVGSSSWTSTEPFSVTSPVPTAQATRRKRRLPGRPKASKIIEEFEWMCPVGGCGRVHMSLKMKDGTWVQEKDLGKGAIQVFV